MNGPVRESRYYGQFKTKIEELIGLTNFNFGNVAY